MLSIHQQFVMFASLLQIVSACDALRDMQGDVMPINTAWFVERLAERRISQRQLARLMGLDPAAISLMLRGKRRMTVDEAAQMAVLLQSTTTDVLVAAGVPVLGGERVPVLGHLQPDGTVVLSAEGAHDTVEAPPGIPVEAAAVQSRAGDLTDGWLYFTSQAHGKPDACLGSLALVAQRDGSLGIAHVRRGYRRGTFNLVNVANTALQSVELAWAAPVYWIRTGPEK